MLKTMAWHKPYTPSRNQRLDPDLYTRANQVCFITISAYGRYAPFAGDALNTLVLRILREEADRQRCALFIHCLMPDHLHFLASPREDGASVFTLADRFKGRSTNAS